MLRVNNLILNDLDKLAHLTRHKMLHRQPINRYHQLHHALNHQVHHQEHLHLMEQLPNNTQIMVIRYILERPVIRANRQIRAIPDNHHFNKILQQSLSIIILHSMVIRVIQAVTPDSLNILVNIILNIISTAITYKTSLGQSLPACPVCLRSLGIKSIMNTMVKRIKIKVHNENAKNELFLQF